MKDTTTTKKDKIIKPQAGFQEQFVASSVDVVFGGGNLGGGKQAPVSSHVLTPEGWKKMGDIKVRDEIVTPFDGIKKVIAVFPQGIKPVYKVRFADGREAECGLEHLWTVRTSKQLHKYNNNGKPRKWTTTLTAGEIITYIEQDKKLYVPMPHAVEFQSQKELPIPPYVLGVMIGDGCLANMGNTGCFKISNTEEDIIQKVADLTDTERIYRQPHCCTKCFYTPNIKKYREYLKEVGLDTYSYNKFIPKEYLFASVEQRKELLAGLFDTDGNVGDRNCFRYFTTSRKLKDDFVHLCRSLGYSARVSKDKRTKKYTAGTAYSISIRTDDYIFTSKKHMSRVDISYNKKKSYSRSDDHVRIMSITYDREEESQCILVDDEKHLYICDDFVTTHNSYALILATAEACMTDPDFRMLISRKQKGNIKKGGGFVDKIRQIYGDMVSTTISDDPRATFPNGAAIDMTYIDGSDMAKLRERAKGWEYDVIAIDEITELNWEAFAYIMTRNRGQSKVFTGHVFATLNPMRSHWTRVFLDWYIGQDGFILPDRNGKVRFFYVNGPAVKDVVWGNTKYEVYCKCKIDIDRKLKAVGGNFSYENLIKSFVFYQGKLGDNKKLVEGNADYIGSVAASGGKTAQAIFEGNFNVDPDEEDDIPIPSDVARDIFTADPQQNGDRWITVDLADLGTDNLIAYEWNGFHIVSHRILTHSTPRENAYTIKAWAADLQIPESRIIFDATSGRYFNDYIPEAMPFVSASRPIGLYHYNGTVLKDICYLRLVRMINKGKLSIAESVAQAVYKHQNLKYTITIQTEILEECSVVRFKDMGNAKKKLMSKKEMNAALGKGRSMDCLDPMAMRMLPCVNMEYGTEFDQGLADASRGRTYYDDNEDNDAFLTESDQSIYDDSIWS